MTVPDDDIKQAVEQAQTAMPQNIPWYMSVMREVPYRPPLTTNRISWIIWFSRCLSWGMTSALYKIFAAVKKHPWVATLGVGGAVAMCPTCVYSTGCIIGALALWAVKTESEAEAEIAANDPAGEFMQ